MNLLPFNFEYEYRFVFSDLNPPNTILANAYIKADLRFQRHGDVPQAVFMFTADFDTLVVVAQDLESSREQGLLNSADDIEDILSTYSGLFPVYAVVNVTS